MSAECEEGTWPGLSEAVRRLEADGVVSRTFRRLDSQRQELVLQAILAEAQEVGLSAVNIKRVAQRAGVSVGSLYQYFGNREHLVESTITLCREYVVDIVNQSTGWLVDMPLEEALFAYVYCGCDWMKQEGLLMKLFARAAYSPDSALGPTLVEPVSNAMLAVVRELLRSAVVRGELPPDADIEGASVFVHANLSILGDTAMLVYLNSYFRIHGNSTGSDLEATIRRWVGYVVAGLGVRSLTPAS